MKAPKPEMTSNIKPIEAGTINAICCGLIDLGTQRTEWQGVEKDLPKIMLIFEVDETYEKDGQEYRRNAFAEFTFSLGSKANLRKFLEGWVGKKSDDEWYEFDITELVGKPCLLNIVHTKPNAQGKVYANVASAAPLVKGMQQLEVQGKTSIFDFECEDKDELDEKMKSLPKFVADKIRQSKQYLGFSTPVSVPTEDKGETPINEHDDNLPF